MKKVLKSFLWAFFIIGATSFVVADEMGVDPIVLAGAFLAYYLAARELDAMLQAAEDYNKRREED
ncbi:MAG: hypothetical protein LC687_04010 [Actinobacteria bacterium]|nr:hypothetical protein [Actinomycetota bacterium]